MKAGSVSDLFVPTFLDLAGPLTPTDMEGRSLLPLLHGEAPGDWRKTMYYRYYHDPGASPHAGALRLAEMKAELDRLRKEFKDDDQFPETIPPNGVDGVAKEKKPLGGKTTAVAIALTAGK